jgi:hypothetical protein
MATSKDGWKKIEVQSGDTWDYKNDKEIQGVLLSKEENVGPNNSKMYKLQTPDGKEIGVWGSTVLDLRFGKIEIGEEIKLIYLGKEKSPKTGREYHSFEVYHRAQPMVEVE